MIEAIQAGLRFRYYCNLTATEWQALRTSRCESSISPLSTHQYHHCKVCETGLDGGPAGDWKSVLLFREVPTAKRRGLAE